jgi:hypothetical protein
VPISPIQKSIINLWGFFLITERKVEKNGNCYPNHNLTEYRKVIFFKGFMFEVFLKKGNIK